MEHLQRLEKITERVNLLIKKKEQYQHDFLVMRQENEQLQQLLKERDGKVQELESQMQVLKLAKQVSSGGEVDEEGKAELKKKINEFIKEIDKCVALLNN